MRDYFRRNADMRFIDYIDGDFLNERDGKRVEGGVEVTVRVEAKAGAELLLNGIPMRAEGSVYSLPVTLRGYRNALLCENLTDGTEQKITLFTLRDAIGKFRFSSDDNIIFLADITEHKDEYTSIFDNPYLAVYKRAHDLYGAKIHLNLFYEFDNEARSFFSDERPYFNLSMMTDKFREEFRANSDWLKLAFHSHSEFPDNPYANAAPEKITEDCIRVHREIVRFAGAECINSTTTTHFGSGNLACVRALRSLGYTSLTGYFELDEEGMPLVAYYAPKDLTLHVGERDFWCDTEEDMVYARIDRVTNIGTLEEVMADVEAVKNDPHRGGFISLMIHEQYFHRDYINYLPDFERRVLEPLRLLTECGYTSSHIADTVREPELRDNPFFR